MGGDQRLGTAPAPITPFGLNIRAKNTGFRRDLSRNRCPGRLRYSFNRGNSSNKSVARTRVRNAFFSNDRSNTTS